jgi:DNA repair photolyase
MAERGLVRVAVSITSLDRALARSMEPRAATPERRVQAVKALSQAGVPVAVMAAPMIPGLNDHELEAILERAAQAGARSAGYVVLRLPREIKDLFREWLETDHPDRARKVMSLVRQMRGGKDYDAQWGQRMRGEGPLADLIARRFGVAKKRLGLDAPMPRLETALFRVPGRLGAQLDLFAGPGVEPAAPLPAVGFASLGPR